MPIGVYKRTLRPIEERLKSRLTATETGCWVWNGSTDFGGYGQIAKGGYGKEGRRLVSTHRISWEIKHGPIPSGMLLCHTCDVRLCCNPDHMFLGTHAENSADMIKKGRSKRGMALPQTKLTDEQILEIRTANGVLQADLAKLYGVSQAHISNVRAGRRSGKT